MGWSLDLSTESLFDAAPHTRYGLRDLGFALTPIDAGANGASVNPRLQSMEIQRAIEILEKSVRPALCIPQGADLDVLASAETLMRALEGRGKKVGALNSPEIQNENLSRRFGQDGSGVFKKIADPPALLREFIVTLDTSSSPISQLRYEKSEEKMDIILSPQSLPIKKESITFREGRILCDCIIALGVKDVEALDKTGLDPALFTETPLVNIDLGPDNKNYGEVNLVDPKRSSLAELVYELLTHWSDSPLDKESATLLLLGIFEKTRSLKTQTTNADTLLTSSELLRLGADLALVRGFFEEKESLSLLQLFGRAAVRSRAENSEGVLWSFLTDEDFSKTGRGEKDIPSVLRRFEETFPQARIRTLLFQTGPDRSVGAVFSGAREILLAIEAREAAAFQSPYLKLEKKFADFREAEEHVNSLLKEVL